MKSTPTSFIIVSHISLTYFCSAHEIIECHKDFYPTVPRSRPESPIIPYANLSYILGLTVPGIPGQERTSFCHQSHPGLLAVPPPGPTGGWPLRTPETIHHTFPHLSNSLADEAVWSGGFLDPLPPTRMRASPESEVKDSLLIFLDRF